MLLITAVIQKQERPELMDLDIWHLLTTGQESFFHLHHICMEFSPCFKPLHFRLNELKQ